MVFERELRLMEILAGGAGPQGTSLGVSRAAEITGMNKAQVSRIFAALDAEGLVDRDPKSLEYRIGWRLPALLASSYPLRLLQRVELALSGLLAGRSGVGASFGVLRQDQVLVVYAASANRGVRQIAWEDRVYPAWCTSPGLVLLSELDEGEIREMFGPARSAGKEPAARPGPPRLPELFERLAQVRADGYAVSEGEFHSAQFGVAAPARDETGQIVGAVSISGVRRSVDDAARVEELAEIGRDVARAADRLSHDLGWVRFPVG